jgi:hypothetical protein
MLYTEVAEMPYSAIVSLGARCLDITGQIKSGLKQTSWATHQRVDLTAAGASVTAVIRLMMFLHSDLGTYPGGRRCVGQDTAT